MNTKQKTLMFRLEHHLMRLRGCIDAMIMVDDSVQRNDPRYRESTSTLHTIMDDDLRSAIQTFEQVFASGGKK